MLRPLVRGPMSQLVGLEPRRFASNGDFHGRLPAREAGDVEHALYYPSALVAVLELGRELSEEVHAFGAMSTYLHGSHEETEAALDERGSQRGADVESPGRVIRQSRRNAPDLNGIAGG